MKALKKIMPYGFIAILLLQGWVAEAALDRGEAAPSFAQLESLKKKPMKIVYFFKVDSKPSRGGLDHLKGLYERYEKEGIGIVAISSDAPGKLDAFLAKNPLPFPVVRDDGKLFKSYQVKFILPVTYILGPGGEITDVIEGGGESPIYFITTVAQRSLQMNRTEFARTLYEDALKSDPKNVAAQKGLGEVYLKEGKLDRAEAEFTGIARRKSPDAVLGKEGLAQVHLKKGETEKALSMAKEVEKENPDSGLVHLIKGNVLAAQGKNDVALSEFTKAAEGKLSSDAQVAEAYNGAGRIHSERGEYKMAEKMYQEAVVHNPYSSEILSNRGVLYEKEGQPQKALALYQEAASADPDDAIAKGLIKRIERHLAFKEDMERQKRVDSLVADLVDRYQKGKVSQAPAGDSWSSRPMTVAFLEIKTTGGGLLREGMTDVIEQEMTQNLMADGRVSVVEREVLDKLLAELKLGSSELADPDTALKLGKILSARLMMTGSLIQVPDGVRLSLRLIDPETSAIRITFSDETGPNKNLTALADESAKALNEKIREEYPLRGKIAS
ncbi:MAG TPA: tetratricopeptide repeat protein, partial [Nitrospiria bacterium]|nr:tetratricopeptide repeat protein [Nitrospiria bacterium]